jgi:LAS superfamily LD-carboxypeptidase LdcB
MSGKQRATGSAGDRDLRRQAERNVREKNKRKKNAERQRDRENRRAYLSYALGRLRVYIPPFLFFFVLICVIALIAFLCSLFIRPGDGGGFPKKIMYGYGDDTREIRTSSVSYDGLIYADFSEIAESCGISVSGDRTGLKFLTPTGEYASFATDSRFADVNGNSVMMDGPARLIGGRLWLPVSFIDRYVSGVSVFIGEDRSSVLISRDTVTEDTLSSPADVSFLLKAGDPIFLEGGASVPVQAMTLPGGGLAYSFINDLSGYYAYMNPADADKYLLLINPTFRDDGTYEPEEYAQVLNSAPGRTSLIMERGAEKALEAMFIEMYSSGYRNVYVNMAYRSYADQSKQFNIYVGNERVWYRSHGDFSDAAYSVLGRAYLKTNYLDKKQYTLSAADAERVASSYSAVPGTGDHQTGFSVDLVLTGSGNTDIEKSEVYVWLQQYAYQFGFVERYPKGKEKITGFSYEPRHWRFVGQYHAAMMREKNMCLEEYRAWLDSGE